jgi:hypothetical protein
MSIIGPTRKDALLLHYSESVFGLLSYSGHFTFKKRVEGDFADFLSSVVPPPLPPQTFYGQPLP